MCSCFEAVFLRCGPAAADASTEVAEHYLKYFIAGHGSGKNFGAFICWLLWDCIFTELVYSIHRYVPLEGIYSIGNLKSIGCFCGIHVHLFSTDTTLTVCAVSSSGKVEQYLQRSFVATCSRIRTMRVQLQLRIVRTRTIWTCCVQQVALQLLQTMKIHML